MMPSAQELTYFVQVAQSLNISKAAHSLGMSQPSVSLAIRRVEETVGVPLFIRSKRGVKLTQAGLQLYAHSKHLLELWENVSSRALDYVYTEQGTYSIGCHPSVALYSLHGFLPQLLNKFPRLNIKLHHDLSRKITDGVIDSSIDIGIVVNPIKQPDLIIKKLCDDEVGLWVSAKQNTHHDLKEILRNDNVLICDPGLLQTQTIFRKLKKNGVQFERTLVSSNLEVIAKLTASGCGIGVLPARVASFLGNELIKVPGTPIFHDEICVLFRMENKRVKAIQTCVGAIQEFFARG